MLSNLEELIKATIVAEELLHQAAQGIRFPVTAPSSRQLHDAARTLRKARKALE